MRDWRPVRRAICGWALVAAPLLIAVSNLCYAIATVHGGDDLTGAGALALATDHPGLMRTSTMAALAACLLFVPASLGLMRALRERAPGAGTIGASLMLGGYVCYFAAVFAGLYALAMADLGATSAAHAKIIDEANGDPITVPVVVLFVLGNLVGTAIVAIGLWRSRIVARQAALGVLAWPVFHIIGMAAGTEWFEVVGALLMTAGLGAVGRLILATPVERWDVAPAGVGERDGVHPSTAAARA